MSRKDRKAPKLKLPIEKGYGGRNIGQFASEYPDMGDICAVCGETFGKHHGKECLKKAKTA